MDRAAARQAEGCGESEARSTIRSTKIVGAGSAGVHHAHAARRLGWSVDLCDIHRAALDRVRNEIFPSRYGVWDDSIRLVEADRAPAGEYDIIIIASPPETHAPLALAALEEGPKAVLIEKPVSEPGSAAAFTLPSRAEAAGILVFAGYDHAVAAATRRVEEILNEAGGIGPILTIDVEFREHWGGILRAHPWLRGPADSYLGHWRRGGGACGEHSHAINLWQHLARLAGCGRVVEASATLDYVSDGSVDYDRLAAITLKTESGLVGRVVQDVITTPPRKWARLQGEIGYIEWHCGYEPGVDAVVWARNANTASVDRFAKTRPDDFIAELAHIDHAIAAGREAADASPLSLRRGLDTLRVITAAHTSTREGRSVPIAMTDGAAGPERTVRYGL